MTNKSGESAKLEKTEQGRNRDARVVRERRRESFDFLTMMLALQGPRADRGGCWGKGQGKTKKDGFSNQEIGHCRMQFRNFEERWSDPEDARAE